MLSCFVSCFSQISYPPANIYNFDELVPLLRTYVDGYDRRLFNFSLPWNVYFQKRSYRNLWICSDGTLHFTQPAEAYSGFEDRAGYYPAYIRVDSVGVTANIRVLATADNFSVEFYGADMRFSQSYKFCWVLTYRRTNPKQPEVFDVDILTNTMGKTKGIVRSDEFVKEIDVSKRRLTRYKGLSLSMRKEVAVMISLGVALPVVALLTFVGVFCCLVGCICCRPCLRCCMECCCSCFSSWLEAQSGWNP